MERRSSRSVMNTAAASLVSPDERTRFVANTTVEVHHHVEGAYPSPRVPDGVEQRRLDNGHQRPDRRTIAATDIGRQFLAEHCELVMFDVVRPTMPN